MKVFSWIMGLCLFTIFPAWAQAQAKLPEADTVKALLQAHHVPAVGIGIIRDGQVSETRVYGRLAANELAPPDALFNVASLTKPVVTMLTLKLVNEGQWSLDEPLARYWTDPDVQHDPNAKKLTTRHVLSHQTGFLNWRWLHATKKLTFDAPPGTKYGYSGEGFEYLRKALEKKFGTGLDRLADSLIFTPLKMEDSRLRWDANVDEARFAKWHDQEGRNSYETYRSQTPNAADDLLTTVADYTRFGAAVVNGFGLAPALFREMVTPASPLAKNSSMTLGWEHFGGLSNGEYAILHTGSDKGVKTLVLLFPKSKSGLVVLTNGDNGFLLYEKLITSALGPLGMEFWKKAQ
ncbi:MAG TPA: serine hydrolase domain-containing protein [Chitinophagaceae bacterium]|nr:serine hydrolase domain-containing protein [Chitinophagaceae bacterium]